MVRSFQTTIDQNQSKVLLIASSGVFSTQLMQAIKALHLDPISIDPSRFLSASVDFELQSLCREAYVCIWLDFPVFCDQEKKKKSYEHVYELLKTSLRIPLIIATFDAFKARENGREGKNPTYVTQWLVQTALKGLRGGRHVDYQHVIYPYEGGVSITQRLLLEKIAMGNSTSLEGSCSPLWYSDVIEHLVSLLYDVNIPGGVFEGKEMSSYVELERTLRKLSHYTALSSETTAFPYTFSPHARQIGQVPVAKMVDELSLILPKPTQTPLADTRIEQPVILPTKKIEVKKNVVKPKLWRFVSMGLAFVMIIYILVSVYFLATYFSVRSTLASFVTSPIHSASSQDSAKLSRQLSRMNLFVSTVPFPYTLMEIHLDKQRIVEGILSMHSLVDATAQFEQEKKDLYFSSLEGSETRFDTVYQELSSLQAKLSQGDLTFDLVFGIDGLSEKMRQKLVEIRQEVSQEKAVASFYPHLMGKNHRSTIALISFSTDTSRPLFGIPQQIVISTMEEGRVLTSVSYDPESLDSFLKGVTEPPMEMKAYLGTSNWKLSQGAWSVDGPTASRQLAWFLSKELHQDIDAILMFSTRVPADAQTEISQTNRSLPPSLIRQPIDISTVLGTETSTKIEDFLAALTSADKDVKEQLVEKFQQEFSKGNVALFTKDAGAGKTLQALSWDGSISTPSCPTQFSLDRDCVVSTRYVGEYDLDKSDIQTPFVSKKEQYQDVLLSPEKTIHTDTIVYPALSTGTQRKLLKYVVDEGSSIQSIVINGHPLDLTDYTVSQEFSKAVFSFAVELARDQETTITVTYETAGVESTKSAFVLFAQKQLGKESENFQLTVRYPQAYTAKVIAPAAHSKQQTSVFTSSLQTNKLFAIGF